MTDLERKAELKPCPFCGAKPILWDDERITYTHPESGCFLDASLIYTHLKVKGRTAVEWNTRAESQKREREAFEAGIRLGEPRQWDVAQETYGEFVDRKYASYLKERGE